MSSLRRSYKICEHSLRWVLNMKALRASPGVERWQKAVEEDGHSGGSYAWTTKQSMIIEEKGLEYWMHKTKGPAGYEPHISR